jgi:hypothetical protein
MRGNQKDIIESQRFLYDSHGTLYGIIRDDVNGVCRIHRRPAAARDPRRDSRKAWSATWGDTAFFNSTVRVKLTLGIFSFTVPSIIKTKQTIRCHYQEET